MWSYIVTQVLFLPHTQNIPRLQESKLYYDTERGTYYYFDPETRKYSIHSRVKLPTKLDQELSAKSSEPVINLCSSEEEFAGVLSIANDS